MKKFGKNDFQNDFGYDKRTSSPITDNSQFENSNSEKSNNNIDAEKSKKKDPNANFYALITAFFVMLLIFICSFLNIVISDKEFSAEENRILAQKPSLSASALLDGSYMKDVDSYLSDQFACRSFLVRSKTVIDLMAGKKEENNVYIGKNGFLFERPTPLDKSKTDETISAINAINKKYPKIKSFMMIAPNSSEILPELMPKNAPSEVQQTQISSIYTSLNKTIKTVDITPVFKNQKNRESLYYRTDHHWTTTAAKLAFDTLKQPMGIDDTQTTYKIYAVSNTFKGTLASSSGIGLAKDIIYATIPQSKTQYIVKYTKDKTKSASLFDSSKLKNKNQYEVFMGGNFPEIKIETSLNSKKVLLIIKDSYANCLIPMLTPYYKNIIVVDPRYYTDDINELIKQESVSDMLWLYNANTFLADTSISTTFSSQSK